MVPEFLHSVFGNQKVDLLTLISSTSSPRHFFFTNASISWNMRQRLPRVNAPIARSLGLLVRGPNVE